MQGFFAGAMFGVVAIIAAVVIINVKKTDLPSDPADAGRRLATASSPHVRQSSRVAASATPSTAHPRTLPHSALDDVHGEAAA